MAEQVCPQCNVVLKEGARFCHLCGYRLPEEIPVAETKPLADSSEKTGSAEEPFAQTGHNQVPEPVKKITFHRRVINIIIKPTMEWEVVAAEKPGIPALILYSLVMTLIPVAALIFGYGLVGRSYGSLFLSVWHRSFSLGFFEALVFFISALTAIITGVALISMLAPAFKSEKNFGRALQLTVYTFTPVFVAAALYILPLLSVLSDLLGLYGAFIMLLGIPVLLKTPKDQQIGYFFASAGILYGLYFIIGWILSLIFNLVFATAYLIPYHL